MFKRHRLAGALLALLLLVGVSHVGTGTASSGSSERYLVVFAGDYAVDGTYAVESTYAVLCTYAVQNGYAVAGGYAVGCNYAVGDDYAVSPVYAVAHEYAVSLVEAAGGTVVNDLLGQIGVFVVDSSSTTFADVMRSYAVVDEVGQDVVWQGIPAGGRPGGGGPVAHSDPAEALQWNMAMIRAPQAHGVNGGWNAVDVGILDSGIDGTHVDFRDASGASNVDCARGRNFVPEGPGIGSPSPCIDNQVHGTHVAGIVAARANGIGVVGVAPNVTLVPVKVCDAPGFCYASAVVGGLTYAGDAELDVINMSFFVDDDALAESTELKCTSDPNQRAFRESVGRAMRHAVKRGVTPVAAIGNSDTDLAQSAEPAGDDCDVVPAETAGVTATVALGPDSEKAGYSSYGAGAADVSAPGGNAIATGASCGDQILATIPGGYGCLQGTSMASPHAAGVAALVVSRIGKLSGNGDVKSSPSAVADRVMSSVVDIGLAGYDECFGHGRIDALRAVTGTTSTASDASAPFCAEYTE
jgi:lantibiotic leader peptide-processing serine protease